MARLHGPSLHHLSASECETMAVSDLLLLADAADGWSLDIERVAAAMRGNTRVVCISFPTIPPANCWNQSGSRRWLRCVGGTVFGW
jgi:histidinol-phosphate/aromatic aminotransferase/cobyric acid decarboxylase-like protein